MVDPKQMTDSSNSYNAAPVKSQSPTYSFTPVRNLAIQLLEADSAQVKLISVVAPVGYGKTVLLSCLFKQAESQDRRCYWCSLDERDTQIEDVLQRLESHSRRLSQKSSHPTQTLFRGGETWETRIDHLVQMIHELQGPISVYIDNLHFCTDPRLRELLDRFIFSTKEDAHFIFSSTSALPFNIVRARLEGQVKQFGFQELRLDFPEIVELFGEELSEKLGDNCLRTILDQTEGWPAAVRMMQIAMAQSETPSELLASFSGSDQDLVALLSRQVLNGLRKDIRDFLLRIALLEAFDTSLCCYVTEDKMAPHHIRYLIENNLFVMPLDRSQSWYRLHGLMRQCLVREAQIQLDASIRHQILERAAQWCDREQLWRESIEYALSCNALPLAANILERSAKTLVRNHGDIPRYLNWINRLLELGQPLGWDAEYWYVWALVMNQRYDEGSHQLARLQKRLDRARQITPDTSTLDEIERRLDVIKMCVDVFVDKLTEANDKASHWLEIQTNDDPFNITVARCIRSIHASSKYNFLEARESAMSAKGSALQTHSHYALAWVHALTAMPAILEGQYVIASQILLDSLKSLPEKLGENSGIVGTISLLAGSCLVEMGRDTDAKLLIEQGLRTAHSHGFVDALSSGMDAALKLHNAQSDTWLTQIDYIVSHYPTRLAYLVGCHRIRRLLRLGDTIGAHQEADRLGLRKITLDCMPTWAQQGHGWDVLSITLVDLNLNESSTVNTDQTTESLYKIAKSDGRVARMVDLRLMQTVSLIRENNCTQATRRLTQAITLAATPNIIRPFQDRALELAPLIEETRPSEWSFARPIEREFFGQLCRELPISDPALRDRLLALNVDTHLLEPLTNRQFELLLLMETGLTNQQIADRMERSLSTIKGHSQTLYAKLGVNNRSAALAKARVLNLI